MKLTTYFPVKQHTIRERCVFQQSEPSAVTSGGSRISRRGGVHPLGGHGPPTWALFGENVCKNERIGSHRGGVRQAHPP